MFPRAIARRCIRRCASYEPSEALFAGADGLEVYRRLIPEAQAALAERGLLAMEIGYGQREAIAELLRGWRGVQVFDDLQRDPARGGCVESVRALAAGFARRGRSSARLPYMPPSLRPSAARRSLRVFSPGAPCHAELPRWPIVSPPRTRCLKSSMSRTCASRPSSRRRSGTTAITTS